MKRILLLFSLFFSLSFYSQNDTLSIVRHTDNDLVVPKDLKVVFRGVLNELRIDVPKAKSFEVSGNGIIKIDKNRYNFNPGAGSETTINIDIILKNNKKVTEKFVFKIRNIPNGISTINNQSGIVKFNKTQLKNAIINVNVPDKNIDLGIIVSEFTLKLPGRKEIKVSGNKIDVNLYNNISNKLSKYDRISIYDIKFTKRISGHFCGILPIIIEIL